MNLRDRIGIDLGRRIKLEDGIEWAGKHGVRFIDIQLDTAANALPTFDDARARNVRALAEKHDVAIGLHTLSAVNVAEYSPYVSDAVDAYLRATSTCTRRSARAGWSSTRAITSPRTSRCAWRPGSRVCSASSNTRRKSRRSSFSKI